MNEEAKDPGIIGKLENNLISLVLLEAKLHKLSVKVTGGGAEKDGSERKMPYAIAQLCDLQEQHLADIHNLVDTVGENLCGSQWGS
jgi:hypothetical protein